MTNEEIEKMIADCEKDILETEKIIRRLKRQGRFSEVFVWKGIIYDLKRTIGELKGKLGRQ